jgi:hypothetical protein
MPVGTGRKTMPRSIPSITNPLRLAVWAAVCAVCSLAAADEPADAPVRFNRDIRPILADACCQCHGPDSAARQAELRLDRRDEVLRPRDGYAIVVPGKPDESELYRRIAATDEAERMPPAEHPRKLTADEIALIRRWIEQGAEYEKHWSFLPPTCPDLPKIKQSDWVRSPIDRFVLARLEAVGLSPAAEADRRTLIRRVTLDLTGLPPTPEEADAFAADPSPDAYERLVDRLLASPRYGERMASMWLDLARYADTGGYQGDIPRTMWPWRDWVVRAFNANMPYDRFAVEQIAGDLLPDATPDQVIATGFNRNHRINDEDGIILEEFRTEYVADRVDTTATTFLGLTVGCARCHDHKFDPITQKDYYRFFAYFNSVAEAGRGHGNAQPLYYFDPSIQPEIEKIDHRLLELKDPAQGEYNEVTELKERRRKLLESSVTTMVMHDLDTPRKTHVLTRGRYDAPAEEVSPGTPESLPALADAPPNRLGLARWIVDPKNPLTARVEVNRLWQMSFGIGLVATAEDFGTRGEPPTHPELLDWLATEFVRSGWDVKHIQKLIVTSATYRQSSSIADRGFRIADSGNFNPQFEIRDPQSLDPENRLLARGPRFRLPTEAIRDQALAAAGLLTERIGGPPVKPYQPDGLWAELVSFAPDYETSRGSDLYRRSLYTYLRRTVPPPAMAAFDLPGRETCTARRGRTNTPLQALVVMNDPTYVEAARALAARALRETADPAGRIDAMFRRVLARPASQQEHRLLLAALTSQHRRFASKPAAADQFLSVGASPPPADADRTELAAYTAVASLVLNLDETLTKE